MSESPVQTAARFFAPIFSARLDLVEAIADDARCAEAGAVLKPGAPIRFITSDGGQIGGMAGGFTGMDGFREGWREWLEPYEEFHMVLEESLEAGPGTALTLVRTTARPRGARVAVEQEAAALITVEGELVAAIDHYLNHDQARRAAGLAS